MTATRIGLSDGLDRLPSYSPAATDDYVSAVRAFVPRLRAAAASDDRDEAIDAHIGLQIVARIVRDLEMRRIQQIDPGVWLDITYCILLTMIKEPLPAAERVDALRSRLDALPGVLEEAIDTLGGSVPRVFVEAALEMIPGARQLVSEAVRVFAREAGRAGDLDSAARRAGAAVERFGHHLDERLLPDAQPECAAGREVLAAILADEHLLAETPEEIAAVGHRMIAETRAAMSDAAAAMGFASTAAAVAAVQKDRPRAAADLLPAYRAAVAAARDYVCDHDLVSLSAAEELVVEPTPEFMRAALPFAGYEGPGPFDAVPRGFYWVTAPHGGMTSEAVDAALGAHPFASMPTVGVHEAYPGHHTQFVRAAAAPTLARRIAALPDGGMLTIEGWAFYCEEMMEREGFLSDPGVRLMRLNDQLWRACRVVIDMEVHLGQMSFDEAVDFLSRTAHIGRTEARQEVGWYVRAPGYPMSYLIGKREITHLANDWAAAKTGSARAFHDALLDWGAAPPALIRWGMGLGTRPERTPLG